MPKSKEVTGKNTSTTDNNSNTHSVGEVAVNKGDSSDSEDAPPKKVKKIVPDMEKGERPARKPKVRISQYVRGEAPPPAKFVMKLFDRSVDLAQFTLDTPLYPICRAWFENDPHDSAKSDKLKKEEEYKNLPKSQLYSGDGWYDPYIFPKGKPSADFTLEYDTLIPLPSKEELLNSNMAEWKAVRTHARNESNKRALKYKPTLETLRKINLNF